MTPRSEVPRLPAPCKHCGQRVFLSIGEKRPGGTNRYGGGLTEFTLPTMWCDAGSDEPHACKIGSEQGAAGTLNPPRQLPAPSKRGQRMKRATRKAHRANRAR